MLNVVNFLKSLSPNYRTETKALAAQTCARLSDIRSDFHTTAPSLRQQVRSELRFKRALARIDAKLSSITIIVGHKNALLTLARIGRWTQRRDACEKALNIVRRKINKTRNNWAVLEIEINTIQARLRKRLSGSSSTWVKTLHAQTMRLMHEVSEQRRRIANLMTKSALVHNGRPKLTHSPSMLHRLDLLGAQISA